MNKDSLSVGRTKRRAGSMASGGGSVACPDLWEGSVLILLSLYYCFL